MLNYDVIIIGSGIAGYSAALRCLDHGLKTAIISSGQSALHFSSGSIDLLSHSPISHQLVRDPWSEISRLHTSLPQHPYAKIGVRNIRQAMSWFQSILSDAGIPMSSLPTQENHLRITTLGTLKPAWLSQPYVKKLDFDCRNLQDIKQIVMVSIEGFRDFQPNIAKEVLQRNALPVGNIPIRIVKINLSAFNQLHRNPNDFRSIDISRVLRNKQNFDEFSDQLSATATPDDLVIIPAILGNGDGLQLMHKLSNQTGLHFHEVPTMPPSLLGIRIEEALMKTFTHRGGILHKGDEVLGGKFNTNENKLQLSDIRTRKMGDLTLSAKHYILASGSFFSKGLIADRNHVTEPVFGLDISETGDRSFWHQKDFFTQHPHEFLSFGVETDEQFVPCIQGQKVHNLTCVGSVLSGYNPITHGCGGGIAISTAYAAAEKIMAERNPNIPLEARA
ncbi:glycerol-3-phosphate dehydrogenase subunit GlpB [Vibrio salinus]|uniref:glycerol-3-phosphate dehydrogenase subunit GlpB n=1 Tax=Vibrio salinus TaxID=2899784 RepID=UPI001E3E15B0|nr:glycerol-3-phosphate dehydrogenase subunit GlpB [Vibrio salinus]MCE0495154.1 glycerol-3-phosphate dehydrogenase subunit GlpB [Vibrio salinus]